MHKFHLFSRGLATMILLFVLVGVSAQEAGSLQRAVPGLPVDSATLVKYADKPIAELLSAIQRMEETDQHRARLTLRSLAFADLQHRDRFDEAANQLYRIGQDLFPLNRFDLLDGVHRFLLDFAEDHQLRQWQYDAANALMESARVRGQFDSAIQWALYHFTIPGDPDLPKQMLASSVLGLSYARLGKYDSAYYHIRWGLETNEGIQDSTAFLVLYEAEGYYFDALADYSESAQAYLNYMQYVPPDDPAFALKGNYNLSVALFRAGDYPAAHRYIETALQLAKSLNFGSQTAILSQHQGKIFQAEGNYAAALQAYQRAYEGFPKTSGKSRLARLLYDIGELQMAAGHYELAESPIREGLQISREVNIPKDEVLLLISLAHYQQGVKKNQAAAQTLAEAGRILANLNEPALESTYLARKAQVEEALGNFQGALATWNAQRILADSLQRAEQQALVRKLDARYQSALKDQEIAGLNRANDLKTLQLEQAARLRMFFIIALLLVAIIAGLAFRQARYRSKTNEQLEMQKATISRSLEEKENLLREIHHRVKNNLQIVSSLLSLQTQHVESTKAQEALIEGQNRVKAMALIHQNLYRESDMVGVPANEYIEELSYNLLETYRTDNDINLALDLEPVSLDVDRIIPLGLVLNELLTNSLKYAFPDQRAGRIAIDLHRKSDGLHLTVADNGIGLPRQLDWQVTDTLGFRLVRAFVKKMNATLEVGHTAGGGTQINMIIPHENT
ncbi:MAG: tetratricopeptide repeat protein [Lewinellaceae bacterium]|nr:tetratricopeptide repeat protein [Lewinellaceae bacterium]